MLFQHLVFFNFRVNLSLPLITLQPTFSSLVHFLLFIPIQAGPVTPRAADRTNARTTNSQPFIVDIISFGNPLIISALMGYYILIMMKTHIFFEQFFDDFPPVANCQPRQHYCIFLTFKKNVYSFFNILIYFNISGFCLTCS